MTVRYQPLYYGAVSPNELSKEIEAGKFRPVYYFYGSEDYRIKEAQRVVALKFLPKSQQSTNQTALSATKNKLEDIINELSMIPMLGERQLFVISNIESFSQAQIGKILSLLNPPDPNRVLILASPSAKTPRKNTKIFKYLEQSTTAVEFGKLKGDAAKRRINKMLADNKITIDPAALDMIIILTGGDLGGMIAETNKLIDFVGEGGRITKDEVAKVSSDYQAFKVFELADHAATGNYDKAMEIIGFLLGQGEKMSSLLFWMGEHFVGLYLARNKKSSGAGGRDMSWKYKGQLNHFESEQLEEIICEIAKADYELKTSQIKPERLIIEKLIYKICSEHQKKANV
ncbi:MAG: DNA polymerase III subunit delta [candidate division Zixibacteria bacterium HGW-Zixibacteria-1]|nr:MAG: DNA polymerase III subunit delta [candidate division Zixibacteria bacterium HGW-Zixibacteria-1]